MHKVIVTLLLSSTVLLAQAQEIDQYAKTPLVITTSTKKIFNSGKKEEKIEAARAEVGDTIEFSLTYTNASRRPISNVKAALPIPAGYIYLDNSAQPALQSAPADGYLVWQLGSLPAKASVTVSARLKLSHAPASANK